MSKYKKNWFAWATALAIWAMFFLLLSIMVLWTYPRNVIDITMQTDKDLYSMNEKILTTTSSTGYVYANSEYEIILLCDNIKYPVLVFEANTEPHTIHVNTVPNTIPNNMIPSSQCYYRADGSHEVQIAPFLHRTYHSEFTSNVFEIVE